ELALGVGGDADGTELADLRDLQRHVAHSPARAEDQQRLAGFELDLMGEVVGGGAGDRDRRSVGEGDLLRLGHRLGGLEDRVLSEGAQAAGRGPEHLVPDGDVLDPSPTAVTTPAASRPIAAGTDPRVPKTPSRRFQSAGLDRKSTRLNSSHVSISYAVFCLKKKNS